MMDIMDALDWVEDNFRYVAVMILLISLFTTLAIMPSASSALVKSTVMDTDSAFENAEIEGISTLVVYLSEPATETGPSEIYVIGPDGAVLDRAEILPQQSKQTLQLQDSATIAAPTGEFEVVALDSNGDVMSRMTVTIGKEGFSL